MNKESNGKVTLTEIKKDIEYILRDISAMKETHASYLSRIETNEKAIVRIVERQTSWNYGLTVLNVIGSTIATFLGIRK